MMSASEGGHGKADVVREVVSILYYKSVPNADKGEGVKNLKTLWSSLMEASLPLSFLDMSHSAIAPSPSPRV